MAEIGAGSSGHEDEERRPFLPILFGGLVLVACLAVVWGFGAALRPAGSALNAAPVAKGAAVMLQGMHS
jgi:hypothetical protein